MITTAAREGKKKISPYMPQEGIAGMAYHWTVVFMVTLTVNYLVIPFQVSEQAEDGSQQHECRTRASSLTCKCRSNFCESRRVTTLHRGAAWHAVEDRLAPFWGVGCLYRFPARPHVRSASPFGRRGSIAHNRSSSPISHNSYHHHRRFRHHLARRSCPRSW